jgi:hypothetical protein
LLWLSKAAAYLGVRWEKLAAQWWAGGACSDEAPKPWGYNILRYIRSFSIIASYHDSLSRRSVLSTGDYTPCSGTRGIGDLLRILARKSHRVRPSSGPPGSPSPAVSVAPCRMYVTLPVRSDGDRLACRCFSRAPVTLLSLRPALRTGPRFDISGIWSLACLWQVSERGPKLAGLDGGRSWR